MFEEEACTSAPPRAWESDDGAALELRTVLTGWLSVTVVFLTLNKNISLRHTLPYLISSTFNVM